jgi:hypothetical protein
LKLTCITGTPDGGSQFGELEIELTDAGEIGRLSEPHAVTGCGVRSSSRP